MPTIIRVRRDNRDQEIDLERLDLAGLRDLQAEQSAALVALKNRIAPFRGALTDGGDVPPGIRAAATAARYVGHNLQSIQRAITAAKGGETCKPKGSQSEAVNRAFVALAKATLSKEAFETLLEDARAVATG